MIGDSTGLEGAVGVANNSLLLSSTMMLWIDFEEEATEDADDFVRPQLKILDENNLLDKSVLREDVKSDGRL